MSSHPAALIAISKACGSRYTSVARLRTGILTLMTAFSFPHAQLDFMQACASEVMAGSPIAYVQTAKLCGSLFQPDDTVTDDGSSLVSGVDTNFFVNHEEPLDALAWLQDQGLWQLGRLPDGVEFLLIFETPRRRSRSLSGHRAERVVEAS